MKASVVPVGPISLAVAAAAAIAAAGAMVRQISSWHSLGVLIPAG